MDLKTLTDPQSIDVDTSISIEERGKLVVPVFLNSRGEPIREGSDSRPYNTLIDRAVRSLEESTCLDTIIESRVVVVGNSRVDHNDVGLLSLMEGRYQLSHLVQRETLWVSSEDMSGVHVVNISP